MKIGIWVICSGCQEAFLQERAKYVPNKVNRYCSKDCRFKYSNTLRMKKQDPVADFWSFVIKDDSNPDACWGWSGRTRLGYGTFYKQGVERGKLQAYDAHRFSYELHKGPIPDGDLIRHLCPNGGNRDCTNPKHLATGTYQDNAQDKVDQGRSAKGEKNPKAKITERVAIQILSAVQYNKKLRKSKRMSYERIALGFGTTVRIVRDIAQGLTWKHIQK